MKNERGAEDFTLAKRYHEDGNYAAAIGYYKKAAEAGHREAQYELGKMYYEGVVVTKNIGEGICLLKEAARRRDNGGIHCAAEEMLEDIAAAGEVESGNERSAEELYQLAKSYYDAYKDGDESILDKAKYYADLAEEKSREESEYFEVPDKIRSLRFWVDLSVQCNEARESKAEPDDSAGPDEDAEDNASSDKARADDAFRLAIDYYNGENGREKNVDEAARQYKIAADLGDMEALCNHALMLLYGEITIGDKDEDDDEIAAEELEEAANAGHISSMRELAHLYKEGCGVEQNYDLAAEWYNKALESGDEECREWLQALEDERKEAARKKREATERRVQETANKILGMLGEYNKEEAVRETKEAAENGDDSAMLNYALYLEKEDDQQQAYEWLQKAAEAGNAEAKSKLEKVNEERSIKEIAATYQRILRGEKSYRQIQEEAAFKKRQADEREAERKAEKEKDWEWLVNYRANIARDHAERAISSREANIRADNDRRERDKYRGL